MTAAPRSTPPPGPLSGLTVIDMTRVLAGPYCTMVLSDLGARVIKVEVPERGDDSRAFGPFIGSDSAYFVSLNRGKESIALDLKAQEDRRIFEALLARADVLVENFRAGALDRLGFGWDSLHERFPQLIYAAASGFGHTGPAAQRPAYDMVVQAMGGIMSLTGHADGPPTRVGTSVGDITAGLFTAIGINGALYHRTRTGRGMKIDVSMFDCQLAILENAVARYFATGTVPGPLGARHPSITPFEAYETADRHIVIAAGNNALWRTLCQALDRQDLAEDPRFTHNEDRNRNVDAVKTELEATLKTRSASHWLGILEPAGVPCGPINRVDQALSDPQAIARNMVVSVPLPAASGAPGPDSPPTPDAPAVLRIAGNPIKMSAFPDPPDRPAAPALDADRAALLAELGLAPANDG